MKRTPKCAGVADTGSSYCPRHSGRVRGDGQIWKRALFPQSERLILMSSSDCEESRGGAAGCRPRSANRKLCSEVLLSHRKPARGAGGRCSQECPLGHVGVGTIVCSARQQGTAGARRWNTTREAGREASACPQHPPLGPLSCRLAEEKRLWVQLHYHSKAGKAAKGSAEQWPRGCCHQEPETLTGRRRRRGKWLG